MANIRSLLTPAERPARLLAMRKSPRRAHHNNRLKLGVEDDERAALALKGIEGKRLTYQQPRI